MPTIVHTERVQRSAAHCFDVVIRHNRENHPRWEPEVLEIREVTGGPIRLGHRSVMVRRERGKIREVENECVEYVEGRRVAFSHPDPQMDFDIAFDFNPVSDSETDVVATVTMQPHGALRVLTPILKLAGPRKSARISSQMRRVVESTPAYNGGDKSRRLPQG